MMTKNKLFLLAVLLWLIVVACAGCGGYGSQVKPFTELTPQERATFFMSVYNAQHDDYKFWQDQPLTEEQRKVMREKKKVLNEIYPLIMAHNALVDVGLAPEPGQPEAIMELVNQLLKLFISQGGVE